MIPKGSKIFPLADNSKVPTAGSRGHLDAKEGVDLNGSNYGISLDGQWLLVDVDRPDDPIAVEWGASLPTTWTQKTPRGTHRVYKVPNGFKGKNTRFAAGDLKVRGYLVGPGSIVDGQSYYVLNGCEPVEAPEWLLSLCGDSAPNRTSINGSIYVNEQSIIPVGERDTQLYSIACGFRRRGFTESAIVAILRGLVHSGVVEQPPGNHISLSDINRLARQAAKHNPEETLGVATDEWMCASEIALVGPPVKWWVHSFIPRGELVTLYGAGGIGKSSFASWVAAIVTQRGGRFTFVGVEEGFSRFAARSVLGGADRTRLFSIPNAYQFSLPRDAEKLKEQIIMMEADVVYFDSIYSHFEAVQGENAAERARKSLAPLAAIAQSTGATIIAVFHENKTGQYLGSVEMINVARYALAAQRLVNQPLKVWVDKTNFVDPGFALTFEATDIELHDPETGQIQLEEAEDGSLVPMMIKVLKRGDNTTKATLREELDTREEKIRKILQILDEDPEASSNVIAAALGGRRTDALALIREVKEGVVPD